MSDDLVRRLRVPCATADSKEAADRIEALSSIGEEYSGRIEMLEAALREIMDWGDNHWGKIDIDVHMTNIARRALERKP